MMTMSVASVFFVGVVVVVVLVVVVVVAVAVAVAVVVVVVAAAAVAVVHVLVGAVTIVGWVSCFAFFEICSLFPPVLLPFV